MTVIAELTIEPTDFPLGEISVQDPNIHIELERVVPSQSQVFPYFWAHGGDFDKFESHVRSLDSVKELVALERVDDNVLYRVEWGEEVENFVAALVETDAVIMEAHGNDIWVFRLRFPNHRGLTDFHNYCTDHDIPFRLERVYTLDEEYHAKYNFGLTTQQREALVLAAEGGYFKVPREVSLAEIADELGISEQSASERIRRAADTVTRKTMLAPSASDLK